MRPGKWILTGVGTLALLCFGSRTSAQTKREPSTVETIEVTAARPVARAMDVIEKRYGVLIDYVDPPYASALDLQIVRSVRGTPVRKPFPIPRVRTISLQYVQVAGGPKGVPYLSCAGAKTYCDPVPVTAWPEDGITGLIQQVLDQFATQGGPVFLVRKLEMPYGPRWEVYPEEARDRSGRFVYRPDILGANVLFPSRRQSYPTGARTPEEQAATPNPFRPIYHQLEAAWGPKFRIAGERASPPNQPADVAGGENMSARRALANLMGPTWVLRLLYAPDEGVYYSNIVRMPYRPPPRPSPPPPPKPLSLSPRPLPVGDWVELAGTEKGVKQIQTGLAKAGYLHAAPATRWDANAADAIRRFQLANGLPASGKIDGLTIERLEPYLPKFPPIMPPPPNPLGPNLITWLQSTRRGKAEIQNALPEEGFYSGPATGVFDLKTREALKAYQAANGLTPTGVFDDATSRKLAPLLLRMKD